MHHGGSCCVARCAPGGIGRNQKACDTRGTRSGRGKRFACALAHFCSRIGAAHPVRHGASHAFEVGGEGSVVAQVVYSVVAHQVQHGYASLAGIVNVGHAVGEARPR